MNNWSIYSLDFFQNKSRNPVILNLVYVTKKLMLCIVIVKKLWENISNFFYRTGRLCSLIFFCRLKIHMTTTMEQNLLSRNIFMLWICMSNFTMGTILGKGFAQAQVHTNHSTSAEGTSAVMYARVLVQNPFPRLSPWRSCIL